MAHIHVHKGGSGEKMVCFRGNYGYLFIGKFSDVPCGGYTGNSVTNNNNMLHNYRNGFSVVYKFTQLQLRWIEKDY